MTVQAKARPDDTRARIIETAEMLFRRMGFAKTAVADIATELGMSPANIYRFFPSKHAIVEAICHRCLGELEAAAWAVARSPGPASQRLEKLVVTILAYHKENLLTERRVHDMVLVAMEHSWDVIEAHKEVIRLIAEQLLRDGIKAGEFEPVDANETAKVMMRSLVVFMHPVLIAQCLESEADLEAEAHASVRFLLRSITQRR